MLHNDTILFSRDNLDMYLSELAKEYRRQGGSRCPAEIVMVGGASILVNYGFREATTDIDAILIAASSMKDAINRVGDKHGLPNGWINVDFTRTSSYSEKIREFSKHYKTFGGVLEIRTVTAEYLIAMKLMSGRMYKYDLSDVIGILSDHKSRGTPINLIDIDRAVCNLYGDWKEVSPFAKAFIENAIHKADYDKQYVEEKKVEILSKEDLVQFINDQDGKITHPEANEFIGKRRESLNEESMER